MTAFRLRIVTIALSLAVAPIAASCFKQPPLNDKQVPSALYPSKQISDGKQWLTENLNVNIDPSYCYDDAELNCRRYGRLYTWESAQRGCQSLGDAWRLPTNDEWQQLAKQYGGVRDDSDDGGFAAFKALLVGGSSGFNILFSGGRTTEGHYARLEAHGFYWTATAPNLPCFVTRQALAATSLDLARSNVHVSVTARSLTRQRLGSLNSVQSMFAKPVPMWLIDLYCDRIVTTRTRSLLPSFPRSAQG